MGAAGLGVAGSGTEESGDLAVNEQRIPQAAQILARLRQGPATSWELQQLGICCHTRRIFELRQAGYEIIRSEKRVRGKRIVTYTLLGQAELFPPVSEPANAGVSTHG